MPYGIVQADQLQTSVTGGTLGPGNATNFKNRIINGAMGLSQGAAGASVTPATPVVYSTNYPVDRWFGAVTQASKFTAQQTPNATETGYATRVAAGFTNYLATTSSSSYAVTATDIFRVLQRIEGLNIADLAWGTANAKTVTLSFLAYSSLTGTFGGYLTNSAGNRNYVFSYSIPVANTWTQISVTIPGDTTGTWLTTNGTGIELGFSLGSGTTYSTTPGSWGSTFYSAPTGATSVVGTNGATWYITGVQLEVGSNATGFEYRDYGRELILCQRYFQTYTQPPLRGSVVGSAGQRLGMVLPVVMRTAPTSIVGALPVFDSTSTSTVASINFTYCTTQTAEFDFNLASSLGSNRPCYVYQGGSTSLTLSAEL